MSEELLKLLFIAQDYLKGHYDMDSAPLHLITERLKQQDALDLLKGEK